MSSDTLATFPAAPDIPEHADSLRIVPQRRSGQWTAAVAVLVLPALAVNSVLRDQAFQWDVVADYFTTDAVLRGLWLTLWLTAVVMVLGFALGTLLAAFRLSANPVLRTAGWGYVWLFRSIPILVQLLWFNIGALYPQILGVAGRGGLAVGQPAKRQPSLLGTPPRGGVWSFATRGCQHRTYQVTSKVPNLRPGVGATR
ncbi:His/Glu/Gln/Arg/opine family amino acid ABC transporter permease subunit [Streptomyces sp. V4I2]|nr:His/Glu/Gln/Arg/opine family amino acid ABC transporter permease subunit [Streptomyces sp. V4I2]